MCAHVRAQKQVSRTNIGTERGCSYALSTYMTPHCIFPKIKKIEPLNHAVTYVILVTSHIAHRGLMFITFGVPTQIPTLGILTPCFNIFPATLI